MARVLSRVLRKYVKIRAGRDINRLFPEHLCIEVHKYPKGFKEKFAVHKSNMLRKILYSVELQ